MDGERAAKEKLAKEKEALGAEFAALQDKFKAGHMHAHMMWLSLRQVTCTLT